jgi:hypothetical protein
LLWSTIPMLNGVDEWPESCCAEQSERLTSITSIALARVRVRYQCQCQYQIQTKLLFLYQNYQSNHTYDLAVLVRHHVLMNVCPRSAHFPNEILRILEPLREGTGPLLPEVTVIASVLLASSDEAANDFLSSSAFVCTLLVLRDQADGSDRQLVLESASLRNAIGDVFCCQPVLTRGWSTGLNVLSLILPETVGKPFIHVALVSMDLMSSADNDKPRKRLALDRYDSDADEHLAIVSNSEDEVLDSGASFLANSIDSDFSFAVGCCLRHSVYDELVLLAEFCRPERFDFTMNDVNVLEKLREL